MLREVSASERSLDRRKTVEKRALGKKMSALEDLKAKRERKQGMYNTATQQLMVAPRHRLSTVGRRAFAVHGPMVWNSLPYDLRAQQDYVPFKQGLKTWLFSRY